MHHIKMKAALGLLSEAAAREERAKTSVGPIGVPFRID
jgi:hypothetical protein